MKIQIQENDEPWCHALVAEVRDEDDGWAVKQSDGWCIFVQKDQCEQAPVVGELLELYGKGLGYEVRGIVIGGRVYRYLTEQQAAAEHRRRVAESKRKKVEDLERDRDKRDARVAALPPPFRARIERFQAARPDWRAEFEPYELFVCEEAVKVHGACSSVDDVDAFYRDRERQETAGISDQHSGNTFGTACKLAVRWFQDPELVAKEHGAMCALVGCQEYGCWATEKQA